MVKNMRDSKMNIFERIRQTVGISFDLQKGLLLYNDSKTKEAELRTELYILIGQQESTKQVFNKAIQANPLRRDLFNEKFNVQFEEYIEKVSNLKKSIEDELFLQKIVSASTPGIQEELTRLDSLGLLKETGDYKYKKYLKDGLGYLRDELPQVSYKEMDKVLSILNQEGVVFNKVSLPINILKPSQKDFSEEKIQNILSNGFEDKEFVPIVSKDLFILDGHHRWASELEIDEESIIDVYLVNLPAKELIERINLDQQAKKAALVILKKSLADGQLTEEEFNKIQNEKMIC